MKYTYAYDEEIITEIAFRQLDPIGEPIDGLHPSLKNVIITTDQGNVYGFNSIVHLELEVNEFEVKPEEKIDSLILHNLSNAFYKAEATLETGEAFAKFTDGSLVITFEGAKTMEITARSTGETSTKVTPRRTRGAVSIPTP